MDTAASVSTEAKFPDLLSGFAAIMGSVAAIAGSSFDGWVFTVSSGASDTSIATLATIA
jgi:hypothetical protein